MAILTGNLLEDAIPTVQYGGLKTNKNTSVGGSANIDFSGSTGTFKTSTGVNTFGGSSNVFTVPLNGSNLSTGKGFFSVAVPTNGTTAVNVFGTTNGFAGTITSVICVSQDTTFGSITLATSVSAGTQTKIADSMQKPNTAGTVVGTIVTATAFTSAGTMTVVSNSAGNAIVIATFTVA